MILERKVPGVMTINAPAIVVDPASDRFLLAWQQANTTSLMWRMANNAPDSKAGVQPEFDWGPIQPVPLAPSDAAPALAGFKSRTFIAWKMPAPTNTIMVSYRDGPIWVLPVAVPGAISAYAPRLVGTADELYVFWRALVGAPLVLWSKSSNGQVWSVSKQIPGSMAIWDRPPAPRATASMSPGRMAISTCPGRAAPMGRLFPPQWRCHR